MGSAPGRRAHASGQQPTAATPGTAPTAPGQSPSGSAGTAGTAPTVPAQQPAGGSAGTPTATAIEAWLAELGIPPPERIEREGIAAWDVRLDGQRRYDVRVTVILDPATGAIVWAHLAPPLGDGFRRSYRRLLRWNDEIPFVKFALTDDERPMASVEIPAERLDRDQLGLAIVRLLAVCDLLLDEMAPWIWIGGRAPDPEHRPSRQAALLAEYGDRLGELGGPR